MTTSKKENGLVLSKGSLYASVASAMMEVNNPILHSYKTVGGKMQSFGHGTKAKTAKGMAEDRKNKIRAQKQARKKNRKK